MRLQENHAMEDGCFMSVVKTVTDDDGEGSCRCSGHESKWSQPEEGPAAGTATLNHCHSFPGNIFQEILQPEAGRRRDNITLRN